MRCDPCTGASRPDALSWVVREADIASDRRQCFGPGYAWKSTVEEPTEYALHERVDKVIVVGSGSEMAIIVSSPMLRKKRSQATSQQKVDKD